MTTFILAEKEKQGRSYMDALGIKYANAHSAYGRGSTFLDDDTVVIGAEGHLFELAEPEQYDPKYKDRLDLSLLPIFPQQFKYEIRKNLINRFNLIKGQANHADRIIVA
ncbi:MAG: toprim domain-containing protein, partial [Lactobacillus crispatus]|nr:toprim domain-containing protein [Lactobacillus crispatus]MCT7707966.1 toprim domain-containing protein [Lactobacillus crispatus]